MKESSFNKTLSTIKQVYAIIWGTTIFILSIISLLFLIKTINGIPIMVIEQEIDKKEVVTVVKNVEVIASCDLDKAVLIFNNKFGEKFHLTFYPYYPEKPLNGEYELVYNDVYEGNDVEVSKQFNKLDELVTYMINK